MYLIPFLHQTTTRQTPLTNAESCILFHFYIKPQPNPTTSSVVSGCILFHFYIKPQPDFCLMYKTYSCILFHFYIKPQPLFAGVSTLSSCILFHFYIKPQPTAHFTDVPLVVSYSISTSNHNFQSLRQKFLTVVSYSISTSNHNMWRMRATTLRLYLIPFLHQTTTLSSLCAPNTSCILFHFYIKPQLFADIISIANVVSYSISTSNHNYELNISEI